MCCYPQVYLDVVMCYWISEFNVHIVRVSDVTCISLLSLASIVHGDFVFFFASLFSAMR